MQCHVLRACHACFAFIRILMSTPLLQGLDLLRGLFDRDPAARLTAAEAQRHPWFAAQLGWEAESLRITAELPAILDKVRVRHVWPLVFWPAECIYAG